MLLSSVVASGAHAGPLKLAVQSLETGGKGSQAAAGRVGLAISGARSARSVALYVNGRFRQRDRSWPWRFGRDGQLKLPTGRHQIAVKARVRRKFQVRRRSILVALRKSRNRDRQSNRTEPSVGPAKPIVAPEPAPAATSPLWRGDYETGDLSQWELVQRVGSDRISITSDPVRQGNYAARYEVRPGDNIGDTSTRAEVGTWLEEREGEERYYRWYTYFTPSFPTNYPDEFVTFTQWRADDESASYGSFMVWGDRIELRRDGTRWSAPLTTGVWHKFVYHVKWSPDPNVGFIELWYDDQLVMPRVHVQTMGGSPGNAVGNYVKQGLYKSDEIPTSVLYHDGFVSGSSFAEVNEAP
ncbi:MAG TPA: polysaccharide lyase [Solirubrobacterales bacterium]|nr:polysaccharide lyase [Solirubrobacterales bacterium]